MFSAFCRALHTWQFVLGVVRVCVCAACTCVGVRECRCLLSVCPYLSASCTSIYW